MKIVQRYKTRMHGRESGDPRIAEVPKSVDIELRCTQASFFNLPPESAWTAGLVSKGGAAVPCLKQGIAHACACCFKSGARPRSPFCHLSICTVPAQHEELTAASAAVKHMQAQPRLLSPTSSSSTYPPPPSPALYLFRVLVQHCPGVTSALAPYCFLPILYHN